MGEVKANKVAGWDDCNKPGDYFFLDDTTDPGGGHIAFYCPCGNCKRELMCMIPIKVGKKTSARQWQWNGDREKPTLTPSIQRHVHIHAHGDSPEYKCEWHGYLTDGVFKSC